MKSFIYRLHVLLAVNHFRKDLNACLSTVIESDLCMSCYGSLFVTD